MRRGLKQNEISKCACCDEGVSRNGTAITFFEADLCRHVLDIRAIQRQTGLEQIIGNAAVAFHMGQQEELTNVVDTEPNKRALICDTCAMTRTVFELYEAMSKENAGAGINADG